MEVEHLKKKVRFLIDTGAAVSVLSKETFTQGNKKFQSLLNSESCRLTTASGQGLETYGAVEAKLEIGSTRTNQKFIVADLGSCEGILGLDFLESNLCTLDLAKGIMLIQHKSVKLCREDCDLCSEVKIEKSVIIPPRCEMFVEARVIQKIEAEEIEGLIEGTGDYSQGQDLTVPRSLVIVEKDKVFVPVTNFSEKKVLIKPDTVIAKIQSSITLSSVSASQEQVDPNSCYCKLPEHLEELILKVSPKIKPETREKLREVLRELSDAFLEPGGKLGRNGKCPHCINVEGRDPVKHPARRYPIAQREIVEEEVDKMLKADIKEPSSSPSAANILLISSSTISR